MKEQIKNLRIKIDGLAQLTKGLEVLIGYSFEGQEVYGNSKEIEKSVDSLYLAKAWLGKVLGELGQHNPYGSGYKTKEDIVSTQDVYVKPENEVSDYSQLYNHIEKVDWLRTEIQKLDTKVHDLVYSRSSDIGLLNKTEGYYRALSLMEGTVRQHLSEARFWLGFEMERIKNENN